MLSIKPLSFLCLIFLSAGTVAQQLDPDYHVKIVGNSYHKLAIDANNDLFVFGAFHDFEGQNFGRILKIAPNGMRLPFAQLYADGDVTHLKILSDGKILIAGRFTSINNTPVKQLLRLNTDGTIDNTFSSALEKVESFDLQDDGKIVAIYNRRFHRLLADGSVDASFNSSFDLVSLVNFCIGNDNSVYFSVLRKINKLSATGSTDLTFKTSTMQTDVGGMYTQSDGKILITGNFTQHNNHTTRSIVRMNTDGEVDPTFQASGANSSITTVLERPDHHLVVAGNFNMYNTTATNLVELNANGSFFKSIGQLTINNVSSIVEGTDAKITIGGEFHSVMNQHRYGIARFNSDYTLDGSFIPVVTFNNQNIRTLQVQNDGSLYVGGYHGAFGVYNGQNPVIGRIANIHPDGTFNPAFTPFFTPSNNYGMVYDHFVLPDNKVVVSGGFGNGWQVIRLNEDGSKDQTFVDGAPGIPPGKIVKHGDELLLAGAFTTYNGVPTPGLVAISIDGGFIRSYDALPSNSSIYQIDFQQDGKMILLGEFPFAAGVKNVIRLTLEGEVDESFSSIRINGNFSDLAVDSLNSIYVVGLVLNSGTDKLNNISKYSPNGTLDMTFHPWKGISGFAHILSIEILPNHNIAIGGVFEEIFGFKSPGFAILDKNGKYIFTPTPMFGKGSVVTDMVFINDQLYLSGILTSSDAHETYGIQKVLLNNIVIPQSPTTLVVAVNTNGIASLSWNDNSTNEVAFVLEQSPSPTGVFIPVDTVAFNSTQTQLQLGVNSMNTFRLRAFNYAGSSPYTNTVSVEWYPVPSGQISLTNSTPSDSKTKLSWTSSLQHHNNFVVQRKLVTESTFKSLDTLTNTTATFDDVVLPNVPYHYRVGAFNANGVLYSNELTVEWKVLPEGTLSVSVSLESAGIALVEWTGAIKYHDGFIIKRKLNNLEFVTLDTVAGNVVSFTNELAADQNAIYQVSPYNKAGSVPFLADVFHWIVTGSEPSAENEISVYPVPTQRYITLSFPRQTLPKEWGIKAIDGRVLVVPYELSDTEITFDLDALTKGVYLLHYNRENKIHFTRIVKY